MSERKTSDGRRVPAPGDRSHRHETVFNLVVPDEWRAVTSEQLEEVEEPPEPATALPLADTAPRLAAIRTPHSTVVDIDSRPTVIDLGCRPTVFDLDARPTRPDLPPVAPSPPDTSEDV